MDLNETFKIEPSILFMLSSPSPVNIEFMSRYFIRFIVDSFILQIK